MPSTRVQLRLITGWFLSLVALLGIGAAAGVRLSMTEGVGLFVLATIPVGILLKVVRDAPLTVAHQLADAGRARMAPRAASSSAGGIW